MWKILSHWSLDYKNGAILFSNRSFDHQIISLSSLIAKKSYIRNLRRDWIRKKNLLIVLECSRLKEKLTDIGFAMVFTRYVEISYWTVTQDIG